MDWDLRIFDDQQLDKGFLDWLVEQQWADQQEHFGRLWDYYHNPSVLNMSGEVHEPLWVQAQETGLPARLTGRRYGSSSQAGYGQKIGDIQRKEIVIENDIGWRVQAMSDFLFGGGVNFVSRAAGAGSRGQNIERVIKGLFESSGGAAFFEQMATLGGVYGFVDCLLRLDESLLQWLSQNPPGSVRESISSDRLAELAMSGRSGLSLELIDAPRALPILEPSDYRQLRYYVQHYRQPTNQLASDGAWGQPQRRVCAVTEIFGPTAYQRYEDGRLVSQWRYDLGFVPVVHIQNIALPFCYEGISEVQQLIGLQDELNTRLSERASRITMQAFQMYLAKGFERFADKTIGPGKVWFTNNPDASVETFGGDAACPSENAHIAEIREAMDKVSGVTPVVAGVLKNKIGNLTSATALKLTFMGMAAKNARKQKTYGQGLQNLADMALMILDKAGIFHTEPHERLVEVVFANPLETFLKEQERQT